MLLNSLLIPRFYNNLTKCVINGQRRRLTTLLNTRFSSKYQIIFHFPPSLHINTDTPENDIAKSFNTLKQSNYRNYSSNVTCRLNWDSHSGLIVDLIRDCDFVALDVEYTGLHIKDERFIGVEKCYESHVSGAKNFIPCQIGLTMAKFESGCWKVTPTSLFTIPSEGKTFSVNMSTLNFLKDNNFDFNSWIRNGICHLTPKEEEERKHLIVSKLKHIEELSENIKKNSDPVSFKINDYDLSTIQDLEDRSTVAKILKIIEEWMHSENKDPIEFEVESAFLRLLIHSVISIKYPNLYSNSCKKNNLKFVCVYKSQLELLNSEKDVLEQELEAINKEIGIRTLFDTISKNSKILVGHNCFYDILHIYQTYYHDLPEQVDSFKKEWVKVFPKIFDTKYISEFYQLFTPQNSLKMLYDSLVINSSSQVKINGLPDTNWSIKHFGRDINDNRRDKENTIKDNKEREQENKNNKKNTDNGVQQNKKYTEQYKENKKNLLKEYRDDYEHDAGYDSFMTSMVFINQLELILKSKNSSLANLINNKMSNISVEKVIGNVFGEVVNSVRLVKCQPSVINMDNEEDMSKHFYMFGFPNIWKKWEIMKIWSPLWVSISWIDETSCWIIAKNSEDVKNINLIYRMMKNPQFKLYNYGQYLQKVHNNTEVLES